MELSTVYVIECRQLIYNYPEQLFADAGVMAIEHADFEGVERLALVTGNCLSRIQLLISPLRLMRINGMN